jgi:large subunit ribosomal protein L31
MKKGIHPETRVATVTCASCGQEVVTRWGAGDVTVETCSQCHPAYTGKAVKVTGGSRIARFEQKLERSRRLARLAGTARNRPGQTRHRIAPRSVHRDASSRSARAGDPRGSAPGPPGRAAAGKRDRCRLGGGDAKVVG